MMPTHETHRLRSEENIAVKTCQLCGAQADVMSDPGKLQEVCPATENVRNIYDQLTNTQNTNLQRIDSIQNVLTQLNNTDPTACSKVLDNFLVGNKEPLITQVIQSLVREPAMA